MLGSVPLLRDCAVIRKSCHSGRAMECIARSGIQENEIISKSSRSRLVSRFTGLGRDDGLGHSLFGAGYQFRASDFEF